MADGARDVCPECMEHGCLREAPDAYRCPSCGKTWRARSLRLLDARERAEARERERAVSSRRNRSLRESQDKESVAEYQRWWRESHRGYRQRYHRNRYYQARLCARWAGDVAEVYRDGSGYLVVDVDEGRAWETASPKRAAMMWSMVALGADAPGSVPFDGPMRHRALMSEKVAFCKEDGPRFKRVSSDWGDVCAEAAWEALEALGRDNGKNKNVLAIHRKKV